MILCRKWDESELICYNIIKNLKNDNNLNIYFII